MKNNQKSLVFAMVVLATFAVACGFFGANSNVATNSTSSNKNATNAQVAKNEDLPMLAAPKLVEMFMTDTEGLNARLKNKEIIVIGVLKDTMNGVQLDGGPLRTIYCTMAFGTSGSDEKYQTLSTRPYGAKKPIVEVKGVYTQGILSTSGGVREVSISLDKCTISSIKD